MQNANLTKNFIESSSTEIWKYSRGASLRFLTGTVHSLDSSFASLKRFSKSLALWVPSHSSPLRLSQHIGICLLRRFLRASNFIVLHKSYRNLHAL